MRSASGSVLVGLLCALLALGGCRKHAPAPGPTPEARLNIAAAADLKFALDEIAAAFRQGHPRTDVRITYGSSGNFFSQLSNKAPFDLFLSADVGYPRKLIENGLGDSRSEVVYGIGRIVLWAPKQSSVDVTRGLDALTHEHIKRIAIANPRHAPYGRAAEAALRKHQLWDTLHEKFVFGENIAQTAQFVESGSAQAGILALSLALSPQMKSAGRYFIIPQTDYPPIEQAAVILSYSPNHTAAEQFRQFVISAPGQAILQRYGLARRGE